jgi:hypothetical protein
MLQDMIADCTPPKLPKKTRSEEVEATCAAAVFGESSEVDVYGVLALTQPVPVLECKCVLGPNVSLVLKDVCCNNTCTICTPCETFTQVVLCC